MFPQRTSAYRSHYRLDALEPRVLLSTFGIIGDFTDGQPLHDVANQMKSWSPDYIVTVGDNWYSDPTIDDSVGQSFHDFISPYTGSYGAGSTSGNRFWPTLGNHDYDNGVSEYLNYFTLPNKERYYTVQEGNVGLFIVNSNTQEPDGTSSSSKQATWLKNALAASTATWKLVFFHHPAYTSGTEGDNTYMQWPFQKWGATAVISGHDHIYERLLKNNFPYFVDGLGGAEIVPAQRVESGSQIRYWDDYGAIKVDAESTSINFQFITRTGQLIDSYTIGQASPAVPSAPTGISASPWTTTNVQLLWNDASPGTTSTFKIERSTDNINFTQIGTTSASVLNYLDSNLTPGTTYYYRVRASNSAGDSNYSSTATAALASGNFTYVSDLQWVGTPTNGWGPVERDMSVGGSGSGDGHTITLNGITYSKGLGAHAVADITYNLNGAYSFFHSDVGVDDETGAASGLVFQVFADGVKVFDSGGMTQASQTQVINLNIAGVQQLRLHVDDLDGDISYDHADWAGAYVVAPGTPPTVPGNLAANAISPMQVNLSWADSTGETSYLIERSTDNKTFTQIGTAPANATSYSDSAVAGSTTYYYRIRATNGLTSGYSNVASATTPTAPTPPAAPSNLTAQATSSTQISLTWTDNSSNETGFKIERSLDGSTNWTLLGTVTSGVTSYVDSTNVLPSTTYYYRVRATNFAGDSANSNVANATTPADETPGSATYIAAGSVWKYLDNGSNQGTAWRATSFNDSTWKSGAAQLGYGDGDETTVVSYGSNANSKYVTTYFRKALTVSDPTQVTALALKLVRDDGAIVYLNGTEVYRNNMPTGTISYSTLASTAIGGADESAWYSANINPALLVAGTNVIAVEIHQSDRTSSDISFDFSLTATLSQPATIPAAPTNLVASAASSSQISLTWADNSSNESGFKIERSTDGTNFTQISLASANATSFSDTGLNATTKYYYRVRATNAAGDSSYTNIANATTEAASSNQTLIAAGSVWKYLDNGSNQGTSWRATSFNDSTWKSGAAQLGYGDGDETTVVSYGSDPNNKYVTTYFRASFNVADPSQVTALMMQIVRDDGCVVYLNGTEVYRNNMPTGTISYNTLAVTALGGADESAWNPASINPALLVAGTNVIAVEIHQSDLNSSDISFDFQLAETLSGASMVQAQTASAPLATTSTMSTLTQQDALDALTAV